MSMKYLKGATFFLAGFTVATGLFVLVLLALGEDFEHAASMVVDGFFLSWLATAVLVGGVMSWIGTK